VDPLRPLPSKLARMGRVAEAAAADRRRSSPSGAARRVLFPPPPSIIPNRAGAHRRGAVALLDQIPANQALGADEFPCANDPQGAPATPDQLIAAAKAGDATARGRRSCRGARTRAPGDPLCNWRNSALFARQDRRPNAGHGDRPPVSWREASLSPTCFRPDVTLRQPRSGPGRRGEQRAGPHVAR